MKRYSVAILLSLGMVLLSGVLFHYRHRLTLTPVLTLDGAATLAAGIIAFVAVWLQIKASRSQIESQLKADRVQREASQKSEILAVEKAILFEIDDFYREYLRDVRDALEEITPEAGPLPFVKRIGTTSFPVFQGNSGKIGLLSDEHAEAIIHFYGAAQGHLRALSEYKAFREKLLLGVPIPGTDVLARINLRHIKQSLPELIKLTYIVCQKLCVITQVPFEWPRVAVAAEKTSLTEIMKDLDLGIEDHETVSRVNAKA
jgi:hypothetical protein